MYGKTMPLKKKKKRVGCRVLLGTSGILLLVSYPELELWFAQSARNQPNSALLSSYGCIQRLCSLVEIKVANVCDMLLVFYTSNLSPNSTVVGATPLGFVFFLFPSGNCGHFYFSIIFFPTKVLTFITEPKH